MQKKGLHTPKNVPPPKFCQSEDFAPPCYPAKSPSPDLAISRDIRNPSRRLGPPFCGRAAEALGSAIPRSASPELRLPVDTESEKSLCLRPSEASLLPQGRQHPRRGPPPSGGGGRRGRKGWWAPTAPGAPDPSPEFINQRTTPLLDEMIAAKPGLR